MSNEMEYFEPKVSIIDNRLVKIDYLGIEAILAIDKAAKLHDALNEALCTHYENQMLAGNAKDESGRYITPMQGGGKRYEGQRISVDSFSSGELQWREDGWWLINCKAIIKMTDIQRKPEEILPDRKLTIDDIKLHD